MFNKLLKLFRKKDTRHNQRTHDTMDLFSENQCKLDDARLVMKGFCVEFGMPGIEGMIDEAWRQIGLRIFNEGVHRSKIL